MDVMKMLHNLLCEYSLVCMACPCEKKLCADYDPGTSEFSTLLIRSWGDPTVVGCVCVSGGGGGGVNMSSWRRGAYTKFSY
jgi:hypothetical protein